MDGNVALGGGAITRARISVPPPGAKGITKRKDLVGQF
jgi:hypothetical protein